MSKQLPLVIILGATGSGKTKLSLELAQKFKGEIISADSMQVYKGLDIITAKATKDEQLAAPHHLLDIVDPQETYTVVEYRNAAVKIIETLCKNNKLPIVVGGTNYYIESLLWNILVSTNDETSKTLPYTTLNNDHELPSDELHKKLTMLDPNMAKRLHPNNKRKILRSLEVLYQKGRKHSDILAEQQRTKGGNKYGGGLRYSNALIFQMQCEQEVLDHRLNKRVDEMVQRGLIEELLNFHTNFNENRLINHKDEPDYTKGIFQTIGFKEFHKYLIMSEEDRESEEGLLCLKQCLEDLKMVTRRYARKQNKWATNRFLGKSDREVPPMFGLNVTDETQWETNVRIPAIKIIESFICGTELKYKPLPLQITNSGPNTEDETFFCKICNRVFIGKYQWGIHETSRRHRIVLERKNRLDKEKFEDELKA